MVDSLAQEGIRGIDLVAYSLHIGSIRGISLIFYLPSHRNPYF